MRKTSATERFWLHANNDPNEPDGCWHFDCGIGKDNYSQLKVDGALRMAHRFAYELLIGPVPDGLEVDHLCHGWDKSCPGGNACMHRRCVNPRHLEAVTPRENTHRSNNPAAINARKTRCPQGHPYDVVIKGRRYCSRCNPSVRAKTKAA